MDYKCLTQFMMDLLAQIISHIYALYLLPHFYTTPGTCHMAPDLGPLHFFIHLLFPYFFHMAYPLTSLRLLLQSHLFSEIFPTCALSYFTTKLLTLSAASVVGHVIDKYLQNELICVCLSTEYTNY